jgi:hypothetical protein
MRGKAPGILCAVLRWRSTGFVRVLGALAGALVLLTATCARAQDAYTPRYWPHADPAGPFKRELSSCQARESRAVEVTHVEPNALAKGRALDEVLESGRPAPSGPLSRPSAADNSTLMYFPPIRAQEIGDCTCWSSAYYYNTYTQARDEGLDAASGDPDAICSPRFLFSLIAEGAYGAECTEHVMSRLSDVGCASILLHPLDEWYQTWPTEAAWVQALRNRTGTPHKIRIDTLDGLEALKQHIANGNCAVTRGVLDGTFSMYPDNGTLGIDNRVWYSREGAPWYRHSVCIVGYDDTRPYVDHRDGQTHYGALLIVNSEGPNWGWYNSTGTGSKGFFWIAYTMFLERQFGYYDDDWPWVDPCYDNGTDPEAYYNDDRPHYRPTLYAVAGINHAKRNTLIFTGGVGPTSPSEFDGPQAIEQTDDGPISISHSRRVAVDLSDGIGLFEPGVPKQVFVALTVSGSAGSSGTMTSADFYYDFGGSGTCAVASSTDPTVTVVPGATGYATALIERPGRVYVDDSNTSGPWDGTPEHPYRTIQDGIDHAESGGWVCVFPGTYDEFIVPAGGVSIIGSGASRTSLAPSTSGFPVYADHVSGCLIEGFTIVAQPGSVGIRSFDSDLTVRRCSITGGTNAFGVNYTGSMHIIDCLVHGNSNRGLYAGGSASVEVVNCTFADNATTGLYLRTSGQVVVTNCILWNNADDLDVGGSTPLQIKYCDIRDGDYAGTDGNFSLDPLFVPGPVHGYCLSQLAAGQGADSPCLDAGSNTAAGLGLGALSTRTDGEPDVGTVDIGYHGPCSSLIDSIAHASTEVTIHWNARAGALYIVEWSDDRVTWHDVPVGDVSSWTDTDAGAVEHRFYRLREDVWGATASSSAAPGASPGDPAAALGTAPSPSPKLKAPPTSRRGAFPVAPPARDPP